MKCLYCDYDSSRFKTKDLDFEVCPACGKKQEVLKDAARLFGCIAIGVVIVIIALFIFFKTQCSH